MENLNISVVFEDFEVGDRIILHYQGASTLGTVISATEDFLEILYDVGETVFLSSRELLSPPQGIYGKPLTVKDLRKGSVISAVLNGVRVYADVLEFVPERRLKYRIQGQDEVAVVLLSSYRPKLEKQMLGWELEA